MSYSSLSDMEAMARWKKTMKAGTTWNMSAPMPAKKRFVDAWPATVVAKSQNEKCSEYTPIDPWGQRHRG